MWAPSEITVPCIFVLQAIIEDEVTQRFSAEGKTYVLRNCSFTINSTHYIILLGLP